ncbi:hypothetical protein Lfu02_78710 [Longispora fulva]|nr:hypothetical protein Lfu02_78710 [Longispora fulva]
MQVPFTGRAGGPDSGIGPQPAGMSELDVPRLRYGDRFIKSRLERMLHNEGKSRRFPRLGIGCGRIKPPRRPKRRTPRRDGARDWVATARGAPPACAGQRAELVSHMPSRMGRTVGPQNPHTSTERGAKIHLAVEVEAIRPGCRPAGARLLAP